MKSSHYTATFSKSRQFLQGGHVRKVVASPTPVVLFTAKPEKKRRSSFKLPFTFSSTKLAQLVVVISILVAGFFYGPALFYRFFPAEQLALVPQEVASPIGGSYQAGTSATTHAYTPKQDATLPDGEWLIIPRIGVRTQLQETDEAEKALEKGVWQVPGYGQPGDITQPMILAAHRYGFKAWWRSDYWKYHSFYLLPDLEPGDRIEVIADKRKWIYEVYAGEENTLITDYTADLILYTCKYLNSPVRHVRYARLVDPTTNTQRVALE
jgi:hypothetical protein